MEEGVQQMPINIPDSKIPTKDIEGQEDSKNEMDGTARLSRELPNAF